MSRLFRLCKGASPLLYLTLTLTWLFPVLYLLYIIGAVGRPVFLAVILSSIAAMAASLLLGRGVSGGLELLELFYKRRRLCVAAPVLYVISYAALVFVIFASIYLYFTPIIILEVPTHPQPISTTPQSEWTVATGSLGNYTPADINARNSSGSHIIVGTIYVRGIENLDQGGRFAVFIKGLAVGGPAGYGWVFYTALWVALLYSVLAVALAAAWKLTWRYAEFVKRAEEFYEKAKEILS
ncbi:hypothetical protein [Pyrobaculum aerophilum]|uniref:Uncharacterized protein n=2 Tax=Pyrobaculum aerophilum TaxID=13773 RepID=Q8ZTZ6_PYRAE|nr:MULTISPECIES: hypothetical protein [Pyrobaculum]AAL64613.1 hypothetical protein PAE3015 [Pyrobaculum aerophilum str. IM2]MCX8137398.1 hypothetical protein [Pyrobaculum aerophilum]